MGLTAVNLADALFRVVGEVFLQDNLWTGVVFVIAILVNSRTCGAFALLGSALGGLTALVLGGDGVAIYHTGSTASTQSGVPRAPFVLTTWCSCC